MEEEEEVHWEEVQDVAPWQEAEEEKVEEVAEEEEEVVTPSICEGEMSIVTNIIPNHDFSHRLPDDPNSLSEWECEGPDCELGVGDLQGLSNSDGATGHYAVVTNRKFSFECLSQDITRRVSPGSTYCFSACVRVSGPPSGCSDVLATVRFGPDDRYPTHLHISRIALQKDRWETLQGTFTLPNKFKGVFLCLDGPSAGVDLLIKSVLVWPCSQNISQSTRRRRVAVTYENVIVNPQFEDGLNNWSGRDCGITLYDSLADLKILPKSGNYFAATNNRKHANNGIQQEITRRVQRKVAYELTALVRIYGNNNNVTSGKIEAILWVRTPGIREYVEVASVQATDADWAELRGKFIIHGYPFSVAISIQGPPPGTDILLNSLVVKRVEKKPPSPSPVIENAFYGVNIIQNSELSNGTNGWISSGNCTLRVGNGSPRELPPMAKESLDLHQRLSGRYILVTNRTQSWMGPSQIITGQLKFWLTYQVSAWVKITSGSPQDVNITLWVDHKKVNVCQVNATSEKWHEIGGSFRIEEKPSKVTVYVNGPDSGVDFMVAGLHIFAVNRHARFQHLREKTNKNRKTDVVLKFNGPSVDSRVKIKQTTNSFPLGSCISRTSIDNEDFVNFFVNNFNWAVFAKELKWDSIDPSFRDCELVFADEMLLLCLENNIQVRGHSMFTEMEENVPPWLREERNNMLKEKEVPYRLDLIFKSYKGKAKHYDVNNEMLHRSFYQGRLGNDIRPDMFKIAKQYDPNALLFVNDYHIEDGKDAKSTPEKYIEHIVELRGKVAPVEGIGIQGHIDSPVGPIVCSALDKLAVLGLPIWFTELDVSSINEHVRADDLEVMLREAFAHSSVDGVVLSGFWEMLMTRQNSHLVNAEGDLNEAGKRLLELKKEWTTDVDDGVIDEQGEFRFRGFHGTYEVEVVTPANKVVKTTFILDKADSAVLVVNIDI